ncbi:MAG: hypothetical protein GYA55_01770 [SAR324 cluster bacterium]|uniref:Uncharacterized protein n=1 Tax=SAR324 cluster bacterium TaxID=2024889 RepID=A0A7X9FPJ1_9DELT|nr:hypothetical protein [SAR324 cluster bacterium]
MRLSNNAIISSKVIPRGKNFTLLAPTEASLASVFWFTLKGKTYLTGHSTLLAPGIPMKNALKIKLKKQKRRTQIKYMPPENNLYQIGVPADGIYVSGSSTSGASWASVITELMASTCIKQEGNFAMVNLVPINLSARFIYLELCKEKYGEKTNCPDDIYRGPGQLIHGEVTFRDSQMHVDLRLEGVDGIVIETAAADGAENKWFEVLSEVTNALAQPLCDTSFNIFGTCYLTMPYGYCDNGAYETAKVTGIAHGPVGSLINLITDSGPMTPDCGTWTSMGCDPDQTCCRREPGNPPTTSFEVNIARPFPYCPEDGHSPNVMVMGNMLGLSDTLMIPCPL